MDRNDTKINVKKLIHLDSTKDIHIEKLIRNCLSIFPTRKANKRTFGTTWSNLFANLFANL